MPSAPGHHAAVGLTSILGFAGKVAGNSNSRCPACSLTRAACRMMPAGRSITRRSWSAYQSRFPVFPLSLRVTQKHSTVGVAAEVLTHEEQADFCYWLAKVRAQHGDVESCLHCRKTAKQYGYRDLAKVYSDGEVSNLRDEAA